MNFHNFGIKMFCAHTHLFLVFFLFSLGVVLILHALLNGAIAFLQCCNRLWWYLTNEICMCVWMSLSNNNNKKTFRAISNANHIALNEIFPHHSHTHIIYTTFSSSLNQSWIDDNSLYSLSDFDPFPTKQNCFAYSCLYINICCPQSAVLIHQSDPVLWIILTVRAS